MNEPGKSVIPRDDFASVFEERTSRVPWVALSVLLHVVVVAFWILAPDNSTKRRERRNLVIKSEQAETLKNHVEDANLSELRAEVAELQRIKAAMLTIRKQSVTELVAFEKTLHNELPSDLGESLEAVAAAESALVRSLESARERIDRFEKGLRDIRPLLSEENLPKLSEPMTALMQEREGLNGVLSQANAESERVGQLIAQSQVLFEWISDEELLAGWETFQSKRTRASRTLTSNSAALAKWRQELRTPVDELAKQAGSHAEFLVQTRKVKAEGESRYAAKKKEYEDKLAAAQQLEKESKEALPRLKEEIEKLEQAYNRGKQAVDKMPTKTWPDRKAKESAKKALTPTKRAADQKKQKLRTTNDTLNRATKSIANVRASLGRLKPYSVPTGSTRRMERIAATFEQLREEKAGGGAFIDEIIAAHAESQRAGAKLTSMLNARIAALGAAE